MINQRRSFMNMKRIRLFFCLFTIGCVGACQRTEMPESTHDCMVVEFTANTESDDSTKANVGVNASGKVQTFWEDGDKIVGPFSTFNGFSLDRDLNADSRRIDYVYYRNATPLIYVCNDTKYDGYYASDHLPVYVDMNF